MGRLWPEADIHEIIVGQAQKLAENLQLE